MECLEAAFLLLRGREADALARTGAGSIGWTSKPRFDTTSTDELIHLDRVLIPFWALY